MTGLIQQVMSAPIMRLEEYAPRPRPRSDWPRLLRRVAALPGGIPPGRSRPAPTVQGR